MRLSIAIDFSIVTGLRHSSKSEKSGEEFYHDLLNQRFYNVLQANDVLELDLDGTLDSYAPSFLDESLGNLVYDFTLSKVQKHLKLLSERNPSWIKMILEETYPQWEERRIKKDPRKITVHHNDWYHINDEGQIEYGQWAKQN